MAKIFHYKTEQFLAININTAWAFFSSPENLALITPPQMDFRILTALDDKDIYKGMLIDYTVKPLFGIRMHWRTEISNVNKPFCFTDKQLKGPYHLWEHTHRFIEKDQGVLVTDDVRYALPLGIMGIIVHSLIVRKKIKNIFSFRKEALKSIFK